MSTNGDVAKILSEAIPRVVETACEIATRSDVSATVRLKAVRLLLRIAGNDGRISPEDSAAVQRALLRAKPLLDRIARGSNSASMRSQAARLCDRIKTEISKVIC
jgi:hypothetical protein